MSQRRPKKDLPWAKLWRRESPRFRALSLRARMLAAYVLKFVDTVGRLPIGKRDPVTAVALAVGADTGDRRWLREAVAELLEHGYLSVVNDCLVVTGWPKWQDREPEPAPAEGASEDERDDANPTRDEPESRTNETRTEPESNPKPTRDERESDTRIDSTARNGSVHNISTLNIVRDEEEEGREERGETRAQTSASPPSGPDDPAPRPCSAEPKSPKRSPGERRLAAALADPRVLEVLGFYRAEHSKNAGWKFDAVEGRKPRAVVVLDALEGEAGRDQLTVDELKAAIRGNRLDAWHAEKGKHELSYVLRPEKVHGFIREGNAGPQPGVRSVRGSIARPSTHEEFQAALKAFMVEAKSI